MTLTPMKMIDVPPMWLFGFAVLVWALDRSVPVETGSRIVTSFGTGLVIGGCVAIVLAALEFRRHRTTIVPHMRAAALITTGPYARSRNPIYAADAVILAGLCLRWDFWPGLVLVPVFMGIILWRFIVPEEERLRAVFDDEFEAYAAKTRRWV